MSYRTVSLALALSVLVVGAVQALPRIRVTDDTFNFGKMPQHAVANHRFWVKSVGDEKVKIKEATPDCGCTTLILKDSVVAPGDSVALDVIFHSRSFLGFVSKRPVIKIAGSNDTTFVKFYAEILLDPTKATPLVINPAKVDVSQFGEKPRRKATFVITNLTDKDFELTVIDTSFKSFDVKLPSVIKAKQQVTAEVIVKKALAETSFEEAFTFAVSDDGMPRYTVPLSRLFNPKKTPGVSLSEQ